MTTHRFHVQLLILVAAVELGMSQGVGVTKHTIAGNDIIIHCDHNTVGTKRDVDPDRWTIWKVGGGDIFIGNKTVEVKHLKRGANNFMFFMEKSKDHFVLFMMIRNVSKVNEGDYICDVRENSVEYFGRMLHLYVHQTEETNPCKDNWLYYELTKTCIRENQDSMGWQEGREFCKFHHNADLVRIRTKEFNDFIASIAEPETPYWIGLQAKKETKVYQWLDDTSNQSIHFYWSINYPKTIPNVDNCVAKGGKRNAAWRNMKCNVYNGVICERSTDKESVWRAPPLWKVLLLAFIMILVLAIFACYFIGIRPQSAVVRTVGFIAQNLGRTDLEPERMSASTVIVIYDSELNDLLR